MPELLFFLVKTFEKPDMFLYQIFILFISPSPLSPEATKLNLFKRMTSMILIFNRLKKTHLEILTVNTTSVMRNPKQGRSLMYVNFTIVATEEMNSIAVILTSAILM